MEEEKIHRIWEENKKTQNLTENMIFNAENLGNTVKKIF